MLGDCPSVLGDCPSVLADRPSVLADRPSVLGDRPSVLGDRPSVLADRPSVLGDIAVRYIPSVPRAALSTLNPPFSIFNSYNSRPFAPIRGLLPQSLFSVPSVPPCSL